jgi:ferredoxin-NADP reductase
VARDRDGFLSVERLDADQPDLREADVLICGPPAMIESLRAQLTAAGVPAAQIHAEEFSFAKLGRSPGTTPAARITRASGRPRSSRASGRVCRLRLRSCSQRSSSPPA